METTVTVYIAAGDLENFTLGKPVMLQHGIARGTVMVTAPISNIKTGVGAKGFTYVTLETTPPT